MISVSLILIIIVNLILWENTDDVINAKVTSPGQNRVGEIGFLFSCRVRSTALEHCMLACLAPWLNSTAFFLSHLPQTCTLIPPHPIPLRRANPKGVLAAIRQRPAADLFFLPLHLFLNLCAHKPPTNPIWAPSQRTGISKPKKESH